MSLIPNLTFRELVTFHVSTCLPGSGMPLSIAICTATLLDIDYKSSALRACKVRLFIAVKMEGIGADC